MSLPLPVLLAIALAVLLTGCRAEPAAAPGGGEGPATPLAVSGAAEVVARVDGVAIDRRWLEALARGRGLDLQDPAQHAQLLDELVEYVVLVEAGRRDPALADPAVRAEIELNALSARASAVMARIAAVEDPGEAALRAEYESQRQINGALEYQVSHLLFADEAVAREAAAALAAGQSFPALRAAYGDRVRPPVELGWLSMSWDSCRRGWPAPCAACSRAAPLPSRCSPRTAGTCCTWTAPGRSKRRRSSRCAKGSGAC